MFVKNILDQKGRAVSSVSAHDTLAEAVNQLATKRIGALLVVSNEETLDGILSERDIIKSLNAFGTNALDRKVETAMTREVMVASEGDSVASIMETMTKGRFRHMPVIEKGMITGMISIGDIVKARLNEMEAESEQLKSYVSG
jgi:CBS domain-containing protein